jgi:hypothetical protein
VVGEPEQVKFAFVRDLDEEEQRKLRKERIPVSLMGEVLDVSRGGFYAWRARAESDRAKEDAELTEVIKAAKSTMTTKAGWASTGSWPSWPHSAAGTHPSAFAASLAPRA